MKLSLDALKERAEATASMDLLATISGGTSNDCHDTPAPLTGNLPTDIKNIPDTPVLVPNPGRLHD